MRANVRVRLGALLGALVIVILAANAYAVEVGQKAPDFTRQAPGGKQVKLDDLLGKGPVVVFTLMGWCGSV